MRKVKRMRYTNTMSRFETKRMNVEEALDELQNYFKETPRSKIKEKLEEGTTLGSGTGTFYKILVVKNKKEKGGKIMEKKTGNPPWKRTIWIDEKLHQKLKTLASRNGKKMGTYVEGLINKSLEGEKKE